jgi:hypothetical protein
MRARHRLFAGISTAALIATSLVVGPSAPVAADGFPTIDGKYSGGGVIGPNETVTLDVTGRGSVPASGVGAVALNVTVTNPAAATYLTVFPTGSSRPTASNVNVFAGQTVPNMVISEVGDGGLVSIYNRFGTVDVVVDVLGWFPNGGGYTPMTPARVLDTRPGEPTKDGAQAGTGALGTGAQRSLPIGGRVGVPADASAVAVNVTVTLPTAPSYLTVWPDGGARPTASSLNYVAGQTVSNMAIVRLGDDGALSLYNHAGRAHVVVDVLGWFPAEDTFRGIDPARLMDTRPGQPTVDGRYRGAGTVGAGGSTTLDVTGRAGVPASGTGAVVLNVAVTQPTADSYVTVWPAGASRPTASNLNFRGGQTVSNMVVADVGDGGLVSLYNLAGRAHVVVDVMGWMPSSGAYEPLTPARLMDTRRTIDPVDPTDPSVDPFDCRTFSGSIVGNVSDGSLKEISGIARGRRDRSVLWVHQDSGAKADVTALSLTGQVRQTFRLDGAGARDWEDMDVGPGPQAGTHYLYMGDIGDNGKQRDTISVWRVPEPALTGSGITTIGGVAHIEARYPDGAHNAEAMAVGADGTIYVITKAKTTDIYAIPYPQSTTGVTTMTKIASGTLAPAVDRSGADVRPDGRAIIIRGYKAAQVWGIVPGESMATTLSREPCKADIADNENFGEAIGFLGNDGSYVTTTEAVNAPIRFYSP